jgi:hypothetical protein
MAERLGDEPLWKTIDRMLDELLRLRSVAAADMSVPHRRVARRLVVSAVPAQETLPLAL